MKLTKHQEKIVDKIVEGKVYDITTYLKEFDKCHAKKYNFQEIEKSFENIENGKRYSVVEEDSYYYTSVYDENGNCIRISDVSETLTYRFKDYPLLKPVKAVLNGSIKKAVVQYQKQEYAIDFNENVLVADSFDDIKEFIALWCYLRNQALIFDVNKSVGNEDIGLFFELKSQEIGRESNPTWSITTTIDSIGETKDKTECRVELVPYKDINDYIEKLWEINDENLKACEDFLDKKIISTGALKVYKQKKYKTVEELSVKANLRIAIIAVIISVISVVIGNVLPLFQKQDTEYLDEISKKISVIEENIKDDNGNSDTSDEINEIRNDLKDIEKEITEIGNKFLETEKVQSNNGR